MHVAYLLRDVPDRRHVQWAHRPRFLLVAAVLGVLAALIRQDPAGLFDLLREAMGGTQAGVGVDLSGDGYVTPDGHSRLIIARYRMAVSEDPGADVPAALTQPSGSMLLGMWTTAATFYGLMFVDFPSLQQLGR